MNVITGQCIIAWDIFTLHVVVLFEVCPSAAHVESSNVLQWVLLLVETVSSISSSSRQRLLLFIFPFFMLWTPFLMNVFISSHGVEVCSLTDWSSECSVKDVQINLSNIHPAVGCVWTLVCFCLSLQWIFTLIQDYFFPLCFLQNELIWYLI